MMAARTATAPRRESGVRDRIRIEVAFHVENLPRGIAREAGWFPAHARFGRGSRDHSFIIVTLLVRVCPWNQVE